MKYRLGIASLLGWAILGGCGKTSLKAGDAAPPLDGGKWLKGEPVKRFEPGKVYVVEFWATWCAPCREAIPHVSQLQAEYAKDGVTFIGQDIMEDDPSAAEKFVEAMGANMNYRVRLDRVSGGDPQQGAMVKTWMLAAGQEAIPCSFVVGKDGRIAWIGEPADLPPVLTEVVAGTFDAAKFAANDSAAKAAATALRTAVDQKDFNTALAKLDQIDRLQPAMADSARVMRCQLLFQKGDYDGAYTLASASPQRVKYPATLSAIASVIMRYADEKRRDFPLAEKLARQAVDAGGRRDMNALSVLANLYYAHGDFEKAVTAETEVYDSAPAEYKTQVKSTLDRYIKAKLDGAAS